MTKNIQFTVTRYHDFSAGHRVWKHEGKCSNLHGHGYRIHFTCGAPSLDTVGRVIDFGVIKTKLCDWLEDNWDHRFLVYSKDPLAVSLKMLDTAVVAVPFNPTAENMAQYLIQEIGPKQLQGTDVILLSCKVEETRKCSASFDLTGV